ncbi:lantibiotic dehydratase [Burkholderia sp. 22PA0106]|uniref:lantibiotic dehydratase n=1 Tax=Burkholderia sp. 22PA0106 TaxID=3237371 RepID=UPI0039C4849B
MTQRQANVSADPADAIGIRLAGFALLRVGGLPARHAADLPGADAMRQHARLRALERERERSAAQYVERLHETIRHAPDDPARFALLALKRAAFGNRRRPLAATLEAWLASQAPATLAAHVAFDAAAVRCEAAQARFCEIVHAGIAETSAALEAASRVPHFRAALALAAPSLMRSLPAAGASWGALPRKKRVAIERTLLAYLLRAATKTSPFSTFGAIALARIDSDAAHGEFDARDARLTSTSLLNRSIAVSLRDALYAPAAMFERDLPLKRNPTFRLVARHAARNGVDATSVRGRARSYQLRHGTLWAEELVVDNPSLAPLLAAFAQLPERFRACDAEQLLRAAGRSTEDARRIVRSLLRTDVLRPAIQWNAHCVRAAAPLGAFVARLSGAAEPARPIDRPASANAASLAPGQWQALAASIAELDELAENFAQCADTQRPAALADIEARWHALHRTLDTREPPRLRVPLYEEADCQGVHLVLGEAFVKRTVKRVAAAIGTRAALSTEYLWLHRKFVQKFGPGGVCHDAASFLEPAWHEFMAFSANFNPHARDDLLAACGPIDSRGLKLPVTAYLQFDTRQPETVTDGEPLVILNAAFNRIGWQSARTTAARHVDADARADAIGNWLRRAAQPLRNVTLSVSGESSGLQQHRRLADAHVCVDEEVAEFGDCSLSDLKLRHDVESGLIEILGPDDAPIRLQYLGGATPMPAWGAKYLLIALAEPVEIGRPAADLVMASDHDREIRHQPRLVENNCVLLRATWWVRARRLLAEVDAASPEARVASMLDFCAAHSIPGEVYVNGQHSDFLSWESFVDVKIRKPVWSRLGNAHCIDAVLSTARHAEWIVFREALPAPSASWCRLGDDAHVSELLVEMVIDVPALALPAASRADADQTATEPA